MTARRARHTRLRRRRLVRMMRSPRPAMMPAIWMEIRLRRARRRHPGAVIRPSALPARCRPRRLHLVRTNRLRWQVHLVGWLLAAVPAMLLGGWPWLVVAPVAFEVVLAAATLRRRRPAAPGGPTDGPWGAGDRHPRTPLPVAGSGAAAAPYPEPAAGYPAGRIAAGQT